MRLPTPRRQYQDYVEAVYPKPMDLPQDQQEEVEMAWYSGFLAAIDTVRKLPNPNNSDQFKAVCREVMQWHQTKLREMM